MMTLYVFRERIRSFYQKYDLFLQPVIRFIVGLLVFSIINKAIGFDPRLMKLPVVLLLSLITAFMPYPIIVLMAVGVSFVHVYYVSKILSIIVGLILLVLYLLFIRLTPKLGIVVLAMPILYVLKIPYFLPLVLGILASPMSAFATISGVIVYYLFNIIKDAAAIQTKISLEDVLQLYKYVFDGLIHNKQMIMTLVIFVVVITVTYIIRKMKIDYAYEIAIVTGAVTCILCFLISDLKLDYTEQIVSMILGTIVSALLCYVVLFFKQVLDYTGVERTQFEDDDYMYYVKAVPKINVTTPQKNVKCINPQDTTHLNENTMSQEDIYQEEYENDDDYDKEEDISL